MSNTYTLDGPKEAERLHIHANADGRVTLAQLEAAFDKDPHYQMPPSYMRHLESQVRQRRLAVRLTLLDAGVLVA